MIGSIWAFCKSSKISGKISKETTPSKIFMAQNHKDEIQLVSRDSYEKTINEVTLKNIQQDIYIEEAYQIILDLVKMQTKN